MIPPTDFQGMIFFSFLSKNSPSQWPFQIENSHLAWDLLPQVWSLTLRAGRAILMGASKGYLNSFRICEDFLSFLIVPLMDASIGVLYTGWKKTQLQLSSWLFPVSSQWSILVILALLCDSVKEYLCVTQVYPACKQKLLFSFTLLNRDYPQILTWSSIWAQSQSVFGQIHDLFSFFIPFWLPLIKTYNYVIPLPATNHIRLWHKKVWWPWPISAAAPPSQAVNFISSTLALLPLASTSCKFCSLFLDFQKQSERTGGGVHTAGTKEENKVSRMIALLFL